MYEVVVRKCGNAATMEISGVVTGFDQMTSISLMPFWVLDVSLHVSRLSFKITLYSGYLPVQNGRKEVRGMEGCI